MKYDDASWHYDGDFPSDLSTIAGSTHIAMFLAWAMLNGLASEYQAAECAEELARLKARNIGPVEWFAAACDGKFTDEDLNDEGNAFAKTYYGDGTGLNTKADGYIEDYGRCFQPLPSLYHVPADWGSYDRIAQVLSRRLKAWRGRVRLARLFGR